MLDTMFLLGIAFKIRSAFKENVRVEGKLLGMLKMFTTICEIKKRSSAESESNRMLYKLLQRLHTSLLTL